MEPKIIGKTIIGIVVSLLIFSAVLLPLEPRGSAEFYVTLFSLIINAVFLVVLIVWVKKSASKKEKDIINHNGQEEKVE